MSSEAQYLTETISQKQAELALLPVKFKALQRENEREIDALCEKAGIMDAITELREKMEGVQKRIQSQADQIQGQIAVLNTIYQRFHMAPIPEGVTHMYGIELEPLDPETRLIVMQGQEGVNWAETILALGGNPEEPESGEHAEADAGEEEYLADDYEEEEEDDEEEEGEDDGEIITALFPPQEPETLDLDALLEDEHPSDSVISEIADEISRIEERVSEGVASDEDLVRVDELTTQLQSVLEG